MLVRQGRVMAATFHPEVTGERRLHAMFASLAAAQDPFRACCGGSFSTVQ